MNITVFPKKTIFALYGTWEGLVWGQILPEGVGSICPYFLETCFLQKKSRILAYNSKSESEHKKCNANDMKFQSL